MKALMLSAALAATAIAAPSDTFASAERLLNVAILHGGCTALNFLAHDYTRGCSSTLTNEVYRSGRVDFTFAVITGSIITFSGGAPQVKDGPNAAIQPVDRVVWKFDAGMPAKPLPAAGTCRFTNPYQGRSTVTCTAKGRDGAYSARFVTDGLPPQLRDF
jgi:hypothetical protein